MRRTHCGAMLDQLKTLHEQLLDLIEQLATETRKSAPDRERLAHVRLRLTRASLQRNQLLESQVYPWLLANLGRPDAEKLTAFRAAGQGLRTKSSGHIGQWTPERIQRDWAGYREASQAMRATMRERISAEKQLLYPHLSELRAAA